MSNKPKNLDDVIRQASEANAAEPIRELSDDEMDRVHGGDNTYRGSLGSGSKSGGCSGGTFCVFTKWTDGNATGNACCVKR